MAAVATSFEPTRGVNDSIPGRVRAASLALSSVWLLSAACASADTSKLRVRAAFDLECAEEELKLTELDPGGTLGVGAVYGVQGCGKRATYVYDEPSWLMNSRDGAPIKSDEVSTSDEAPSKSNEAPSKPNEAPSKPDEAPSK